MAWAAASWSGAFIDISKHPNVSQNVVPPCFQTCVKVCWDTAYLYVSAQLFEPLVFTNQTGHNAGGGPLYHDNDFEFFVDLSSTAGYYKEFEMSARSMMYDMLWGILDQWGLHCAHAATTGGSGSGVGSSSSTGAGARRAQQHAAAGRAVANMGHPAAAETGPSTLPVCVNMSFPGYTGN